ncbi:antirestriction protein ArdA [Cerasibacillus sp. JNUCC 74]
MQVYIANLGKYNEGELVGAWFKFLTVRSKNYG